MYSIIYITELESACENESACLKLLTQIRMLSLSERFDFDLSN
jgi:hypothetical protein